MHFAVSEEGGFSQRAIVQILSQKDSWEKEEEEVPTFFGRPVSNLPQGAWRQKSQGRKKKILEGTPTNSFWKVQKPDLLLMS